MVQSGLLGNDRANIPRVNEMNWIVIYNQNLLSGKILLCRYDQSVCSIFQTWLK